MIAGRPGGRRTAALALGSVLAPAVLATGVAAQEPSSAASGSPPPALRGSWIPETYTLSDGTVHAVDGRIVFTANDWLVVFFVLEDGRAARGSAEGGRYTLEGDLLTFEHLYHLSAGEAVEGLEASPLRMVARPGEGPREPTRVETDGDRLTLRFPSGNAMSFRRGSAP